MRGHGGETEFLGWVGNNDVRQGNNFGGGTAPNGHHFEDKANFLALYGRKNDGFVIVFQFAIVAKVKVIAKRSQRRLWKTRGNSFVYIELQWTVGMNMTKEAVGITYGGGNAKIRALSSDSEPNTDILEEREDRLIEICMYVHICMKLRRENGENFALTFSVLGEEVALFPQSSREERESLTAFTLLWKSRWECR